MKNVNQVIERLNECGITVDSYKENNKLCGYELNTYTDAGVNQILFIDFRDSEMNPKDAKHFIELFNERVNDIDIDEEIKNLRISLVIYTYFHKFWFLILLCVFCLKK